MRGPSERRSTIENLAIFNAGPLWKHQEAYHYDSSYYGFVQELAKYFHQVSVLVPVSDEPPPTGLRVLDTRIHVVELPWYSNIQTSCLALGRYLSQHTRWRNDLKGFDAIILMDYLFPFYWLFFLLAKLGGVRIILYMRANDRAVIGSSRYGMVQKTIAVALANVGFHLLRFLSKRNPLLVAGRELYEIFSRSSPLVRSISPSSVSIRDLAPATGARFDKEELKLLYVGRLQRAKGLEELLEAVSKAADERHRFELDIVGGDAHGGSYLRHLKARVAELGLDDVVRFHGHVAFGEEIMRFYRSSDVFVLPSFSEGRPKVLYEAMIAGMAIIATATGGIPEIIEHGVNGLLVEPGDAEGLAGLLKEMCGDRSIPRRLSEEALRRAPEFTLEKSAEHAARMIKQVVAMHQQ